MFNDKELFQLAEAVVAGNTVDLTKLSDEEKAKVEQIVKDLKEHDNDQEASEDAVAADGADA